MPHLIRCRCARCVGCAWVRFARFIDVCVHLLVRCFVPRLNCALARTRGEGCGESCQGLPSLQGQVQPRIPFPLYRYIPRPVCGEWPQQDVPRRCVLSSTVRCSPCDVTACAATSVCSVSDPFLWEFGSREDKGRYQQWMAER